MLQSRGECAAPCLFAYVPIARLLRVGQIVKMLIVRVMLVK